MVDDKLTSSKDTRGRGDVCSLELEMDADEIESIDDGADCGSSNGKLSIYPKAVVILVENWEVEEERIDGDSQNAGDHKELVPALEELVLGIKDPLF